MSIDEATKKSLLDTNQYFKKIFDLVPQKAYFDVDSNEKITTHRVQSVANNKRESERKNINDKHKLKKLKFDPHQSFKTSELQQILPKLELSKNDENHTVHPNGTHDPTEIVEGKKSGHRRDGKLSNGVAVELLDHDDGIVPSASKAKGASKTNKSSSNSNKKNTSLTTAQLVGASTDTDSKSVESAVVKADEDKISSGDGIEWGKKGKKQKMNDASKKDAVKANAENSTSSSSVPSPGSITVQPKLNPDQLREKLRARISELQAKRRRGMTAEEFLESKKLRRKESKLKLKQKRKEAKKLKLSVEKQTKNSQNKLNGVSEVEPAVDSTNTNNNNKMVFSKFEFSQQAKKPKDRKQRKPKSYRELYEKVTKDKEKLAELQQTDAEKAKKIAEKNAWRKAMEQSKGVKVKDNPELIKKSMKKEEKLKQRSHKKWEERTATVAEQQQKRQDKRKKNIQAKKQSNLDRKMKLAKKKGRMVSGF